MNTQPNLSFYKINETYMESLQIIDSDVRISTGGKQTRSYVGIVLTIHDRLFFAPLSSPAKFPSTLNPNDLKAAKAKKANIEKRRISIKVISNKQVHLCNVIIGKIIPVPSSQISEISINNLLSSTISSERKYGDLLQKEYYAINAMKDTIYDKALRFYTKSITNTLPKHNKTHCVDLQKAIAYHDSWIEEHI
ncbi:MULTISPECIES: type III toxin-antitoxin system ToxN/AbiQ family toxin [unclassified Veillonella]|uniref:type III toxin-antitoxin system ToxN/AbiQ family toxin n=1 Tax=unclassified Veillonella TaxID=2630086 RepID=UPI000F8F7568|nr:MULTISPECIES: type III toxin-antitoxin system ToxN/AbiQ family toxin [unclassified Veillonella]